MVRCTVGVDRGHGPAAVQTGAGAQTVVVAGHLQGAAGVIDGNRAQRGRQQDNTGQDQVGPGAGMGDNASASATTSHYRPPQRVYQRLCETMHLKPAQTR